MRALSKSLLTRTCALLVLASACTTALAGKVYQWKDAQGVSHYADSPPPNQQQVKNRRIDNRGAPVADDATVGKSVENPQCITARLNLQLLAGSSSVQQDTDGDGKPDKVLNDDDRANQRNLAEAAAKAYCTPPPKA